MALSKEELIVVGFAFVDDKDLVQSTRDPGEDGEDVARQFQEFVRLWEELLTATEGELVPEKSFWYLIDFKWEMGRWRYAMDE